MIAEKPIFWDFIEYDDDGFWNGKIKKDAPKEVKKAYEEFMEQKKNAEKQGIRL